MQEIPISKYFSKISCSVDLTDIEKSFSTLLNSRKQLLKLLKKYFSQAGGVFSRSLTFPVVIISQLFYTLGIRIFRNTSECLLFIFFLNYNVTDKNLSFYCFVFFPKIRHLVLTFNKLNLVTCLTILDISLKFGSAIQDIEAVFERCSTKKQLFIRVT